MYAAPSGLNIIPTADILPAGTASLEVEITGADLFSRDMQNNALLSQIGIGMGTELGLDRTIHGDIGTWFNIKQHIQGESGNRPAIAVGIQNIGTGSDNQPYIVGFKSIRDTRLHTGGIIIDKKSQFMLGLDHPLCDAATFQVDYTSGKDNFLSLGGAVNIGRNLSLTGALLIPNDSSADNEYLLNFAWTIN